jgi:hypothetical protein
MILTAADQRLIDTVEKDLANAALILASDIADGRRSRVEMMKSSRVSPGELHENNNMHRCRQKAED